MKCRWITRGSFLGLAFGVVLFAGLLLDVSGSAHAQHTGGSVGGGHWHGSGGSHRGHRSSHGTYSGGAHGSRSHRSGTSGGSNPWGFHLLGLAIVMIVSSKLTRAVTGTVDEALATRAPRWRHEFRHCGACRTISSSRAPECPGCRRP